MEKEKQYYVYEGRLATKPVYQGTLKQCQAWVDKQDFPSDFELSDKSKRTKPVRG